MTISSIHVGAVMCVGPGFLSFVCQVSHLELVLVIFAQYKELEQLQGNKHKKCDFALLFVMRPRTWDDLELIVS